MAMTRHHPWSKRPSAQLGLTFIELMIALAIAGVLVAIAVPSMYEFIIRKRVQGATDELMGDLRLMRSIQTTVNKRVAIKFSQNAEMSCYVIYEFSDFDTCECLNTLSPVCTSGLSVPPEEYKTVRLLASNKVDLRPEVSSPSQVTLHAITGMPMSTQPLSVAVTAPQGGSVKVSTNGAWQLKACSVSKHNSAYAACPP